MPESTRVVITGLGAFTPLGKTTQETYSALLEGKSGIRRIQSFDITGFKTQISAEVDFDPLEYFERTEMRYLDRLVQLGVIAARQALEQANLGILASDLRERVGVKIGVGAVGFHTTEAQIRILHEKGPARVSPHALVMFEPDAITGELCRSLQAQGPSYTVNSACSSGLDAVVNARDDILLNRADMMITGGVGAEVTPFGLATFGQMRALSVQNDDPTGASRPFSPGRDGFVLGEGGVILVLESVSSALRRGVPILAELVGCGQVTDTFHLTQPDPTGHAAARAMHLALQEAAIRSAEVDLISAHGTSTPYNDAMEATAIRGVFGEAIDHVLVNAAKSMAGHLIGAAGPLGALSVIMAMQTGKVHPTKNLTVPDTDCELNHVIGTALERVINIGMINAFGFQGHNTAIVLRRFTP